MKKYILWLLYFIPALLIEWVCWLTIPIVACFVVKRPRTDVVKRKGKIIVTMDREYLWGILNLWNTHDNAADEGWYGMYQLKIWWLWWIDTSMWTQMDYDSSKFIRWYCRVWWLQRNTAYGWHYLLFSTPKETILYYRTTGIEGLTYWYRLEVYPSSFKYEMQFRITRSRFFSMNIGWKEHKLMERKLYANRIIGFRKN